MNEKKLVEKVREAYSSDRDCEHGQLARSCQICELIADRDMWQRAARTKSKRVAKLVDEKLKLERDLVHLREIACERDMLRVALKRLLHYADSASVVVEDESARHKLDIAIELARQTLLEVKP